MSKAQVIEALGRPHQVAAQGRAEYLTYNLPRSGSDDVWYGRTVPYFVRIVDGKVESYGVRGDFGTTVQPQQRIQIEHR
jgi:hypothetical protein